MSRASILGFENASQPASRSHLHVARIATALTASGTPISRLWRPFSSPWVPFLSIRDQAALKVTASHSPYCYYLAQSPSGHSGAVSAPGGREGAASSPAFSLVLTHEWPSDLPNAARIAREPTHFHSSLLLRHNPNMKIHKVKR